MAKAKKKATPPSEAAVEFHHSRRVQAGRFAVQSLYGGRLNSRDSVWQMMEVLRKRWRAMLTRLHKSGVWRTTQQEGRLFFLANCPWFGVKKPADPDRQYTQRTCNCRALCPFCYAREYPIKAFKALAPLLPKLPAEKNTRTLFAFTTETEFDPIEWDRVHPETKKLCGFSDAVAEVKAAIRGPGRRADTARLRHLGAVTFHRVRIRLREANEFTEDGADGKIPVRLVLVRTTLVVTEPTVKVPAFAGTAERVDDPTLTDLARLVGRGFRYPAEWYKTLSKAVVGLAVMLGKARAFTAYGACRNKRAAETKKRKKRSPKSSPTPIAE